MPTQTPSLPAQVAPTLTPPPLLQLPPPPLRSTFPNVTVPSFSSRLQSLPISISHHPERGGSPPAPSPPLPPHPRMETPEWIPWRKSLLPWKQHQEQVNLGV